MLRAFVALFPRSPGPRAGGATGPVVSCCSPARRPAGAPPRRGGVRGASAGAAARRDAMQIDVPPDRAAERLPGWPRASLGEDVGLPSARGRGRWLTAASRARFHGARRIDCVARVDRSTVVEGGRAVGSRSWRAACGPRGVLADVDAEALYAAGEPKRLPAATLAARDGPAELGDGEGGPACACTPIPRNGTDGGTAGRSTWRRRSTSWPSWWVR